MLHSTVLNRDGSINTKLNQISQADEEEKYEMLTYGYNVALNA